jgi:crotonobetainyl-CoA:carnitine CoA-transferase CaiB-like acyl-CoA transferase
MSAAQVPAVRVRTVPEVLAEPHVAVRGVRRPVFDEASGRTLEVPSIGFKLNGQALGPVRGPARLGDDTDAVRRELGLSGPSRG